MTRDNEQFGRDEWVMTGIILSALICLYLPFLKTLVSDWGTNDDYSHGYFIPFLSAYFIYTLRDELRKIAVRPSIAGLAVLFIGLGQLISVHWILGKTRASL